MTTVVTHIDDVAGSHGANVAMFELAGAGAVTSGSVMVPGPWFPELVAHPELGRLDLGIHLTLTSESAAFRWRPLSTSDPASGLIDPAGYLWPTVPDVRRHASPDAVDAELRAQVDTALAAGVDVTHLDSHMGAALAPEFAALTTRIALDYRLPLVFPSDVGSYFGVLDAGWVDHAEMAAARDDRVAVTDTFSMPLVHKGKTDWRGILRDMLTDLPEGVTYLSLHCAAPGEIAVIHPRDDGWRIGEYETFRDPAFRQWLAEQPFALSGMRPFRDELRSA